MCIPTHHVHHPLISHLAITEAIYANGASIFFVGYSLFQVPSNLILLRLGGRVWLSVMLVAWGLAATAFAGMQRPVEFYVLRFLLGLAECGTFPGMWYHLSLFYDSAHMGMCMCVWCQSMMMMMMCCFMYANEDVLFGVCQ